jgi:hypothetical protein
MRHWNQSVSQLLTLELYEHSMALRLMALRDIPTVAAICGKT